MIIDLGGIFCKILSVRTSPIRDWIRIEVYNMNRMNRNGSIFTITLDHTDDQIPIFTRKLVD